MPETQEAVQNPTLPNLLYLIHKIYSTNQLSIYHALNVFKNARKVVKVGHAAREMITVLSVTFPFLSNSG